MNILIHADHYLGWTGGANLLGYLLSSLLRGCVITHDKLLLGVSSKLTGNPALFNTNFNLPVERLKQSGNLSKVLDMNTDIRSVEFIGEIDNFIMDHDIDLIGPTALPLGKLACPWIGYIPDFQHHYLPELFTRDELFNRDRWLRLIVQDGSAIYVNSQTTVNDVHGFFPGLCPPKKVFRFPLVLPNIEISFDRVRSTLDKYKIMNPFFISCSQMWMHKQHDLIIKAFSASCAHATDVEHILVFTGSQSDYRNTGYSEYIQRLIDESQVSKRIIRLGEIDRQDQLDLISASQCLIQASRFEGGPGASGVLEAALLSVPIIASDIPCNLELNIGKCSYFRSGSIDDLSALLVQMMTRRRDIAEAKERTSRISLSRDIVSLSSGLQLLWEFDHILANSDLQVKDDPYVR